MFQPLVGSTNSLYGLFKIYNIGDSIQNISYGYLSTGPIGPTGRDGAKTFVIDHPDDENKYLVHVCLEGPEAGVYYRGKAEV